MAFTLYHADQMPKVEIDSLSTKPLGGGLTEVSATVINRKLIPTHSSFDVDHKTTVPDRVTISGEKLRVITALVDDSVVFQKPHEQKREPEQVKIPTLKGMTPVYIRWIVEGAGPYTVTVRSVKGGVTSLTEPKPGS